MNNLFITITKELELKEDNINLVIWKVFLKNLNPNPKLDSY